MTIAQHPELFAMPQASDAPCHVDVEPLVQTSKVGIRTLIGYAVTWNNRRILREFTVLDPTDRERLRVARQRAVRHCVAKAVQIGVASKWSKAIAKEGIAP